MLALPTGLPDETRHDKGAIVVVPALPGLGGANTGTAADGPDPAVDRIDGAGRSSEEKDGIGHFTKEAGEFQ